MNQILIAIIKVYRRCISPFLGRNCRFEPSCSVYAEQALSRKSFGSGLFISVKRVLRCHPFHPGGFDPVE